MKKILITLSGLTLAIALTACSTATAATAEVTSAPPVPPASATEATADAGVPFAGDWAPYSVQYGGSTVTVGQLELLAAAAGEEIASLAGLDANLQDYFSIITTMNLNLAANGTGTLTYTEEGTPKSATVNWTESNGSYTATYQGNTSSLNYIADEDTLTFSFQGADVTLHRA